METPDFTVDLESRWAWRAGDEVSLTATEWRLVSLFVRNPARLLTHGYILEQVWGTKDWKTNYIRVYMAAIRRKLEPDPAHPR